MRLSVASLLSLATIATAAYNEASSSNVVAYWGQNSINQVGASAQKPLGEYCNSPSIDVFAISFVTSLLNGTQSGLNLANYMTPTNCKLDTLGQIISCDKLGEDIQKCQKNGKTILLSIGGAQGIQETWFDSEKTAKDAATSLWKRYGPPTSDTSVIRPFGKASVDGIDLDIERTNTYMDVFAKQLRTEMGTDGKYLTAAMECDISAGSFYTKDLLDKTWFDMIFVMAYNSEVCNAANGKWQADKWFEWANSTSPNKNVKIFLGLPGGPSATIKPGNGYVKPADLGKILGEYKGILSFAGAMLWDISQAVSNPDKKNYQDDVKSALGGGGDPTATASTASGAPAATG